MNIKPIQFGCNFPLRQNVNRSSVNLERTPKQDLVSFSGKNKKSKKLAPEIQAAVEFSDKILQKGTPMPFTVKNVEAIVQEYSPDVRVLSIDELKDKIYDAQNYGAFFSSTLSEDFNAINKEMFIKTPPSNADETQMLLFAMNAVHEFTHLEQINTQECFNFLKTICKGNHEYAKALMGIGDMIFSIFDTQIQANTLKSFFYNPVDILNNRKYGNFVPRESNIIRSMLPKAVGLGSENDMQKFFSKTFDTIFESMMVSIYQNRQDIMSMLPENEKYENLKSKVKTYCAMKAKEEYEAYTSESVIAKKALNTENPVNIDVFPFYYDILAKGLSK